ncbi:MAG: EAL domain-containing protein [Actinobacteria bacterium]|nr:EAL domain-containing protein [Actinomycetota bacterium]MCA1722232.1 EAL domain-containing protein [Actinomycetota bacterium]
MSLTDTLQLVADTIVESLGFDVAVVNIVDEDATSMVVAAVAGPADVRQLLLHTRRGLESWRLLVAASEPWGRLRFLDHATSTADPTDVLTWIPDLDISTDPNAWHPEDGLFAPLEAPDGTPLGMLSVDVPRSGLRPDLATRHALEAFAVTASLAIQHAHMAAASWRAAARFQAVFDASPIPVGLLGPDKCFVQVNAAFCAFLHRCADNLIGHDPVEFTHPDDRDATPALSQSVRSPADGSTAGPLEKRYLLPDGSIVWGRLHLALLPDEQESGFVVAQLEDITDRKRAELRLVQQAHYDSLTDLPNRAHAMRTLRVVLDGDAAAGEMTAVFFCDVDRLKLVNDVHGHAAGDAYIREIGRRIRSAVRPDDTVGRLGGDEFVVVLPGVRTPTEGIGIAGRVIDAVRQPFRVAGQHFQPSLSLGIVFSHGTASTPDTVLAQADSAMYVAKMQDRGGWHVFDPSTRNTAAGQLALRGEVRRALDEGEFVVHYQPVVRLSDHAVTGHEALLRWQHPERGLLMPADFLDVVLDSEYESEVTDWVLRRACADAAQRPAGARSVAVNLSSLQVGRRELPDIVTACLAAGGLDPVDLVLELTEDRLLSRPDGPELLQRLRGLGVSLAIDDFGAGYAGMRYLQRFPAVNVLKLDRSFIAGVGRDHVSEHIVRSVVGLARSCGLMSVVEGVETVEQADFLRELGADAAQGYHFGRAAPWAPGQPPQTQDQPPHGRDQDTMRRRRAGARAVAAEIVRPGDPRDFVVATAGAALDTSATTTFPAPLPRQR